MEHNQSENIILSPNLKTTKYSSDLIKRGTVLANKINKYSSFHNTEIKQLLKQAKELLEEARSLKDYHFYSPRSQKYSEILTCSEKIIEIEENCAEAWWYKSMALGHNFVGLQGHNFEDLQDALKAVNLAISLKHNFVEALLTKSTILVHLKKYDMAFKTAEEAIDINPDKFKTWCNKGFILKNLLNRIEEADLAFSQAFKIKFRNSNIFYQIKQAIKSPNFCVEEITRIINSSFEDANILSSSIATNSKLIACAGIFGHDSDYIDDWGAGDFYDSIDMLTVFNFDTEKFIFFHCTGYSEDVVFSPDEKLLAQALEDDPVRIYNAQTGELIRTLTHNYSSEYPHYKGRVSARKMKL